MEEKFKDLLRAVERSEDGVTQNVANMIDIMQKYLKKIEELTQPFYTMPAEQMNALITWGFVPGAKVRYDVDDIDLVFEGYTEMMRLKFRKPDGTETIASIESMAKNLKHFTLLARGGKDND